MSLATMCSVYRLCTLPPLRRRLSARAFTLLELLVVIGIITVLAAILLPVLRTARAQSQSVLCQSNQHQLMAAFLAFAVDHEERLPGNYWDSMYQQPTDPDKRDWLLGDNPQQGNAAAQLLCAPQMGTIYRYSRDPSIYLCPTDQPSMLNSGAGSNGRFDYAAFIVFSGARITQVKSQARFLWPSGPSSGTYAYDVATPIICEEEPRGGLNGGNIEGGHCNTDQLGHYHRGGAYYASIDGSVHWFLEPAGATSWNWETTGPSGTYRSLGSVPIPGWGWWSTQ